MSAFANNLSFYRLLKRGVVASGGLLLVVGCATGESTFQDQQAELFSFGDPEAAWVGESNSWDRAASKSLQPPTSPEPLDVSASGKFVFRVDTNWSGERARARVQQPYNAELTLLDVDGRVGEALWCLNHAADFVAPRARTFDRSATENPERQASSELLSALGFVIVDDETLSFDKTCLSQGDTAATRAMLIASYVLWELRARDLDAFLFERESFAQSGELSEDSVAFMRAIAEKSGDSTTALQNLARYRADTLGTNEGEFPRYQLLLDTNDDGVKDVDQSCSPKMDERCLCAQDEPELCRCENGAVEPEGHCDARP